MKKFSKRFLSILTALAMIYTIFLSPVSEIVGFAGESVKAGAFEIQYKYEANQYGQGKLTWFDPGESRAEFRTVIQRIGYNALNSEALRTIVFHEKMTEVAEGAFMFCPNLESFEVDENNQDFSTVDGILYNKRKTKLICFPQGRTETAFTIPDTVTSINAYAFYGCSNLTEIKLPEKLEKIEFSTFEGCTGLKSIHLPETVKEIQTKAFSGCTSLETINLPDSLREINICAFEDTLLLKPDEKGFVYIDDWLITVIGDTNNITSTTIKDGTKGLAKYALSNCENLAEVNIPDSVKNISINAFDYTKIFDNLTDINGVKYHNGWVFSADSDITDAQIADGTKGIIPRAFQGLHNLKSVVIPESVYVIGKEAFVNCENLTSVTIKNPHAKIDAFAIGYKAQEKIITLIVDSDIQTWYTRYDNTVVNCYEGGEVDKYVKSSLLERNYIGKITENNSNESSEHNSKTDNSYTESNTGNQENGQNTEPSNQSPLIPVAVATSIIAVGAITAGIIIKIKKH